MLRTVVVRDASPPYQQVRPPCPVPLTVRDLPQDPGPRDQRAEELLTRARQGALSPRELPLLRAELARFDDRDAVLLLVFHHSASDGWSAQLVLRDLAAYYAARTAGRPAELPPAPPYGEFAAWQQDRTAGPQAAAELAYWRGKLHGARVFALPADRDIPDAHTRHYSARSLTIPAPVTSAAAALARTARGTTFMVLLAAVNVLAHDITGTTDPVIDTLTTGRGNPRYHNTVGPFLNFLALRTDISDATTFRDILTRTRTTCLEAYAHEIPIEHVKRELPGLMAPTKEPRNCDTIFGFFQAQFDGDAQRIADGAHEVIERGLEGDSADLPRGAAWTMNVVPSGELTGWVQYNLDEFDERTVAGWTEAFSRILTRAVADPDSEWKTL
jgi:condensation enzyme